MEFHSVNCYLNTKFGKIWSQPIQTLYSEMFSLITITCFAFVQICFKRSCMISLTFFIYFWKVSGTYFNHVFLIYCYFSRCLVFSIWHQQDLHSEWNAYIKLTSHGILHYSWSADLLKSFSQFIVSIFTFLKQYLITRNEIALIKTPLILYPHKILIC